MPRKAPGVTQYETSKGEKLWRYVLDAGEDPKTGRRRQKKVSGFKTQREAAQAREQARQLLENGGRVDADKITFGEHLNDWLDRRSRTGNERTISLYRGVVRIHLMPNLGTVKLQKLHQSHLSELYEGLHSGDASPSGKPLAPATVKRVHAVVSSALKDAAKRDLIVRNVASLADVPRVDNRKHLEGFWTAEELNSFLGDVRGNRYEVCFRLLAFTGMRIGEALGLRWQDVELEKSVLHVRKQLQKLPKGVEPETVKRAALTEPKTKRSRRTISIGPDVVAMLREHQQGQLNAHLEGGVGNVLGLVSTGGTGHYVSYASVWKAFDEIQKQLAIRRIPLHGLRHTHATLLLSAGRNPLEVSERLGHESVAFTLDRYGHVIPSDAAAVASAAESAIAVENRWAGQSG